MISIKRVPNMLVHEGRTETQVPFVPGRSAADYLSGEVLDDWRVVHNGGVCKDLSVVLQDGDELLLLPDLKVPVAVVIAILKIVVLILAIAATSYSIYVAVKAKQRLKNFGTSVDSGGGGFDDSSATYGWDGIQNTADVGRPISIIYGEHRVGGNVINQFIRTDGDKQYLHTMIGIGEGEIESIGGLKINDRPESDFTGIGTAYRYGTLNQTPIDGFDELHNIYNQDVPLTQSNPFTYTMADGDVEGFEVYLRFPSGLYQQDQNNGAILEWSVSYKVEHKLVGAGSWTDDGTYTVTTKSRTDVRRIFRLAGLTPGQYQVRVTRTSSDSNFNQTGDLYLQSIDELKTKKLAYPTLALAGVSALATDQLSGAQPKYTFLVKGRKVSIPDVRYGGNPIDWADYYWDPIAVSFKRFSDNAACTWDGTTFVEKWSANPIWCNRDLLLNTRYGLGDFIGSVDVDLPYLIEMAKYAEERVDNGAGGYEKRFRMDVVIDGQAKALDVLTQLATCYRGLPFYSSGTIKLSIDKPRSAVQLFGMGNIIRGSFKQEWKTVKNVPNVVEAQFLDKDKDYEQETVAVMAQSALEANEPRRMVRMKLFVTSRSYAIREATFVLNRERAISRTIGFKSAIEAIAVQAGDRFDFSHDVPQWGFSGRIKSGSTTTSIKLDRQVTIESGKTYKLMIRFPDDTMVERTVSNSPGTTDTITVSSAFSAAPSAFDVWSFGETNKVVKPFTIVSMKRDGEANVEIAGIEYQESIYDAVAIVIPTSNYSALSNTPPPAEALAATERIIKLNDGTIENVIDVWWRKPSQTGQFLKTYSRGRVYISRDAGVSWVLRGETYAESFGIIGDLVEGTAYRIAVTTISEDGQETPVAGAPYVSLTVLGKTAPPSNVSGFDVTQQGSFLLFAWNPVSDVDLARYEIRQGSEWATAIKVGEKLDTTDFAYPVGQIGEQTFLIKAIDTSGNESVSPGVDTLNVVQPPDGAFTNQLDLWTQNLEDIRSSVDLEYLTAYNPTYARAALRLRSATTWEEREAEAQTWEYQEANAGLNLESTVETSGSFEQATPFDFGEVIDFKVVVDADYLNVSGGSLTIQIATSEDGSTFSSFANLSSTTQYRARFVKFKLLLATSDANYGVDLYSLILFIQAPAIKYAQGQGITVPVGGLQIVFGVGFSKTPTLGVWIDNGIKAWIDYDSVDKDQATIFARDIGTDAAIGTAAVSWLARGS